MANELIGLGLSHPLLHALELILELSILALHFVDLVLELELTCQFLPLFLF